MTHLLNRPHDFATEALEGFVAAYPTQVARVRGGVVRATPTPPGRVAVVLGGGSGHYPAFAGWVGPGFAHGAACGNTFASPSASQVYRVARVVDAGAGVLLGFGNYAGDVMHFGLAADQLRAEGIDARTIAVTDDVASAGDADRHLRRGVAGDLIVFKIACAAAESGADLDTVEAIAQHANAATHSFGVAFGGCTLPGAPGPLFAVERGQMALGLGVHGEPGLGEKPLQSASEVADLLVDEVLSAASAQGSLDGSRVALLLNGLGGTKYEELFVVYRRVAERLTGAGLRVVHPEVGEHVTSLDMAGLSLSLTVLDVELEGLWAAPADTPAFRRGFAGGAGEVRTQYVEDVGGANDGEQLPTAPGATAASQTAAGSAVEAFARVRAVVSEHEERLGAIDAVAGDGDHGLGMARGSAAAEAAARAAARQGAGVRTTVLRAASAWADAAGGSSGALWGAAITAVGSNLADDEVPTPKTLVHAVAAALESVVRLGGAQPGDKTMVDAVVPFTTVLAGEFDKVASFRDAWLVAAAGATNAAEATAAIPARLGRARAHGEGSLGTPDAGAVSFALIVNALTPLSDRTVKEQP